MTHLNTKYRGPLVEIHWHTHVLKV